MSDFDAMLQRNIEEMNKLDGFSVVIICCSSAKLAHFWQERLELGKGAVLSKDSMVLCVDEDWPGGAGNALGTLYAFQKAAALARDKHGIDLLTEVTSGRYSVGLYHTAGKGTRLAPLPAAENNNKPGVKLPATIAVGGKKMPISILEAVLKQTGCYAKSRPGRLSVFWGDQVFIPTVPVTYEVGYHVDILCSLGPMPTASEWAEKGMDKYGLIAQSASGSAAQVEKVDHATASQMLSSLDGEIEKVGVSLGSFSVSHQMLSCLLEEFAHELDSKVGKLDSDPHLWMPMTLSKDSYMSLMKQKNISEDASGPHFDRISTMLRKFHASGSATGTLTLKEEEHIAGAADKAPQEITSSKLLGLFGPVDVGQGVCWWDYGQLKLYKQYTLLMTENNREAELLRMFFGIEEGKKVQDTIAYHTDIDANSCVSSCHLGNGALDLGVADSKTGFVRNSVLSNVRCNHIEAENCVIINVTADHIYAKGDSITYNYVAPTTSSTVGAAGHVVAQDGDVTVGVFDEGGNQMIMASAIHHDGGKLWDTKMEKNPHSFGEVYAKNADSSPHALQHVIAAAHDRAWEITASSKGK